MSDEGQPAESPKDALLGLTSLDFGPAWARSGEGKKKGGSGEGTGTRNRDDREGDRRDGRRDDRRQGRRDDRRDGRGNDRRDGGGNDRREGRRDDRREGRRDDRREGGGRRDDRRDGQGDRGKRGGRRDDDRRDPRDRDEVPPPEGFAASVMPAEAGLDGLAKEILAGGRTYSVFDLAKLVLGARDRFNVSFRTEAAPGLFRCKKDGSLWLTKEEALQHFWRAEWRTDYYEEVVSSATPPQGNFQTVARCGFSGEWLGPPNYHGYQPALMQLHRERFGHISLEGYKRKIKMERGEEAVAAWLDKMSKRTAYRPTGGVSAEEAAPKEESTLAEDAPAEEVEAGEDVEESVEAESDSADEGAAPAPAGDGTGAEAEVSGESEEAPESEEGEPEPEGAPATSDEADLDDLRAVERHFVENHFEEVFQTTNRAWVGGNIPGNNLSPGLLTLLRHTVAEERRYPGKLTPMLCRQLSGRHVAVFKWRRKLKAGPSRPHPVPKEIAIADRPMALLNWATENSGKKLEHLWKALLPEAVTDEEKTGWYHDLHWLLNQGYVLLMADSTIHRAKNPGEEETSSKKAKTKQAKKAKPAREGKPGPRGEKSHPPKAEPPKAKPAESKAAETVVEGRSFSSLGGEAPGLYAMGGRTLSGAPKSLAGLCGRGLWPQPSRIEEDPGDPDDTELPIW